MRKINQPSSLGSNQVSFNLSLMQMPIPDSDSSGRNQSNHVANSAKNHPKKQVYDLNFFSGKRSGGTKFIGRVVKKPK